MGASSSMDSTNVGLIMSGSARILLILSIVFMEYGRLSTSLLPYCFTTVRFVSVKGNRLSSRL